MKVYDRKKARKKRHERIRGKITGTGECPRLVVYRSLKHLEGQIIDDEQVHFNYFDSVRDHMEELGDTYLSHIAGSSSSTGLSPQGFVIKKGG